MSKVVSILNKILNFERQSADMAHLYAHIARDMAMPNLGKFFEENHESEIKHMNSLMERITQLGGEIELTGTESAKPLMSVQDIFTRCMNVKKATVDHLNQSIPKCRDEKDEASAQLLSNLILDEVEHLDEFEAELDLMRVMGCGSYLTKWTTG